MHSQRTCDCRFGSAKKRSVSPRTDALEVNRNWIFFNSNSLTFFDVDKLERRNIKDAHLQGY